MSATGSALAREEVVFYSDDSGVRVTNSRLISGSTTYAMNNITSVSLNSESPSRVWPLVFSSIGIFSCLNGLSGTEHSGVVFGLFMLGIGVLWWKAQKTKYHLKIASASGEMNAITSTNKKRVESIIQAVNEAIIGRG